MNTRTDIDYSRAALTLRTAGRRGDSVLAHLTPGEVVVPVSVLRAVPGLGELLAESFIRANLDLGRYTVGGGDDSTNPKTGLPEYYDEEPGDTWGGGDDDWGGGGDDWGGGDPYGFEDNKTGGYGGRESERNQTHSFGELSDDRGEHDSEITGGGASRLGGDYVQPAEKAPTDLTPKRGRTVLTSLNVKYKKLSPIEKLGDSSIGKRLLGE